MGDIRQLNYLSGIGSMWTNVAPERITMQPKADEQRGLARLFPDVANKTSLLAARVYFCHRVCRWHHLGRDRAAVRLLRQVATCHQHRDHLRDVPDGLLHSDFAESG